jgi:hypothetical protein
MSHGWVNRGDLREEAVRKEAERAMGLAREFYEKYM